MRVNLHLRKQGMAHPHSNLPIHAVHTASRMSETNRDSPTLGRESQQIRTCSRNLVGQASLPVLSTQVYLYRMTSKQDSRIVSFEPMPAF